MALLVLQEVEQVICSWFKSDNNRQGQFCYVRGLALMCFAMTAEQRCRSWEDIDELFRMADVDLSFASSLPASSDLNRWAVNRNLVEWTQHNRAKLKEINWVEWAELYAKPSTSLQVLTNRCYTFARACRLLQKKHEGFFFLKSLIEVLDCSQREREGLSQWVSVVGADEKYWFRRVFKEAGGCWRKQAGHEMACLLRMAHNAEGPACWWKICAIVGCSGDVS
jgi:hypothetical protein